MSSIKIQSIDVRQQTDQEIVELIIFFFIQFYCYIFLSLLKAIADTSLNNKASTAHKEDLTTSRRVSSQFSVRYQHLTR